MRPNDRDEGLDCQFGPLSVETVGAPVVDHTGLSGRYDFHLDWTPDSGPCAAPADGDGPSIFTALQEKLGLKLESTRSPVEMIFIDYAEKADDN
jgi:uncharacterized protein (TIGR03435 family)